MSPRIADVSGLATKLHRDSAIAGGRHDKEKLLQIGSVVLGETVCDRGSRLVSNLPAVRRCVLTTKADRRRVVVELIAPDLKPLSCRENYLGEKRATIGIEQSVESAPHMIVADLVHLVTAQSYGVGS